jgi:hypothetical protein
MKRFCEWARRRGFKAYWVYAHENPGNREPNTHILFHIPRDFAPEFAIQCPALFDAEEGGVHVRKRKGPSDKCLAYMVKGTDFVTARKHGATARRQGTVNFKERVGPNHLEVARERFKKSGQV